MTTQSISNLRTRADQIRNEQAGNANTPSRVGGLFRDLVDTLFGQGPALTLRSLGCVGDGTTDDAVALQAAVTANPGKVLDGEGLTYKCNSALALSDELTLHNGTINFSGAPDGTLCVTASGSLGTVYTLTANLTYGSKQFQVASTTGLAVGDWVLIQSTKVWSSGVVVGEIARIKTVDSGTLATIETPARSSYNTADTATVTRLNQTVSGVSLWRMKFIGAGIGHGQRLFQAAYTANIDIDECDSTGFENTHYDFYCSTVVRADRLRCREAPLAATGYGVSIQRGCRDVSVTNSFFSYMRHGVTIGGSAWVNRYIRILNNHAEYQIDAGFDAHPSAQYVEFTANTVVCKDETDAGNTDGLTCQCADYVINGNIIVRPYGTGIFAQNLVTGCEAAPGGVIKGNEIIEPGGTGVYVVNQGQTMRGLTVNGNKVTGASRVSGSTSAIQIYALTGAIYNWSCDSNPISDCLGVGITLRGASNVDGNANLYDGTCVGNPVNLSGTANNGDGILLLTCKRVAVGPNNVSLTEQDRFGINGSSTVDCTFTGNVLNLPSGSTAACLQLTGTGSGNMVIGNRGPVGAIGLSIGASVTNNKVGLNDWTGCATAMSIAAATGTRVHVDGTGTPEGNLVAGIGSTFGRLDGGAGTSFYVKESGTGNTGWVAK